MNELWSILIGKKIVAFRGLTHKKFSSSKEKVTPLSYVLFDDGETYIQLTEQDYYTYHDCSSVARQLDVLNNPKLWQIMFNKENGFNEPDDVGVWPF